MSSKIKRKKHKTVIKTNAESNPGPRALNKSEQEFIEIFKKLAGTKDKAKVWEDIITILACLLNSLDLYQERRKSREDMLNHYFIDYDYQSILRLLTIVGNELILNPRQDFLINMYSELEIKEPWGPDELPSYKKLESAVEKNLTQKDCKRLSEQDCPSQHFFIGCDTGCQMLATANHLSDMGLDPKEKTVFIGITDDPLTAMMCFIQISVCNYPGYIYITDDVKCFDMDYVYEDEFLESESTWITPAIMGKIIDSFEAEADAAAEDDEKLPKEPEEERSNADVESGQ